MRRTDKKKQDSDSQWTLIALILIGVGLYLIALGPRHQNNKSNDFSSVKPVDEQINIHLKNTDMKIQLESSRFQRENERPIGTILGSETNDGRQLGLLPLNRKVESHAVDVTRENERNERQSAVQTPAQQIERNLAKDQFGSDYDEKYQQEYVRQFLDNAKDQGMDVELNEDLDVIGIRPRPLEKPLRFPNSDAGSPGAAK